MASPVGDSYSCDPGGSIAGGRYNLPAWLRNQPPLTWAESGANTISALDPANDAAINPNYPSAAPWAGAGLSNIISAWSSGWWNETEQRYYFFGGGHSNYGGNEVYYWDAKADQFYRANKPTGAVGNTGTLQDGLEASAVYFDGQPRSLHTYNNFAMRNGVAWCFGGSPYYTGNSASRPFKWNGLSWDKDSDTNCSAAYGGACYDSSRDIFWIFMDGSTRQPVKYNPTTKATVAVSKWVNLTGGYVNPLYDQLRDVIVLFGNSVHVMSADAGSDSVAITTSGTAPGFQIQTAGAVYDSKNDRYLVWNGGSSVYVLTPPAVGQNPKTATWVWSQIAPVSGAPTSAETNGTYRRLWYSASLNCIGVCNSTNQKMQVFKLS